MKSLVFIALFLISFLASAQKDTIELINGDYRVCKIISEDSTNVYIALRINRQEVETYVAKTKIKSIKLYKNPIVALDKMSLGLGLGMDYGGFGGSYLIYPHKNIGLFIGVGYVLVGYSYNFGCKVRLIGEKNTSRVHPYFLGMYGYNAVVYNSNSSGYNKIFYGSTFGFGIDLRSNRATFGYWTLAFLIPVRGSEVNTYINDLEKNYAVEFTNNLSPLTISLGYRLILD